MEQIKLFYNKRDETYYCNEELKCTNCHKELLDCFQLAILWDKKESWISPFCLSCFNKIIANKLFNITERKWVIAANPPEDSIPIIIRPPSIQYPSGIWNSPFLSPAAMRTGKPDVDAAELPSGEVKDRCKVSYDPNRNIMPEFKKEQAAFKEREAMINKEIKTEKQADTFLLTYIQSPSAT